MGKATAFHGNRLLASGALVSVALAVKAVMEKETAATVLVFDDDTGKVIDLDLRGDENAVIARLGENNEAAAQEVPPLNERRGRGRPKLGVVSREVTLLPRQWDWLNAQPGGASQALRRLVDDARRAEGGRGRLRAAHETAYRFMAAMAGDLPGFEEASRALFAGDRERFDQHSSAWPSDVRAYASRLANDGFAIAR